MHDMPLLAEPIAGIAAARLGEGALWDDRYGILLWVDILGKAFHRYDPGTDALLTTHFDEEVGTVVPRAGGGWVVALRSRIQAVTPEGTAGDVLVQHPMPGLRFNDGKCDPAGRLWVGTYADSRVANSFLYRVDPTLTITPLVDEVICSNGIVWTQDAQTMYYVDSGYPRVDAFDYDRVAGAITHRRPAVIFPQLAGVPDGMAIDANGMLWVAIFHGQGDTGRVLQRDPHTGALLGEIHVPGASAVTSCAFGGADLRTLYITTASCLDAATLAQQPHAGRLFQVAAPVAGVPASRFAG